MKELSLTINEVLVTSQPATFVCRGLGSCIGLFLKDRRMSIWAGAHIPLPSSQSGSEFSGGWLSAEYMLNLMLEKLANMGSSLDGLSAKMAGGSNLYSFIDGGIGKKNYECVNLLLAKHRIFLSASDVGGIYHRTVKYFMPHGDLWVITPNGTYKI